MADVEAFLCIKMYWTPAKMLLLADVDVYNFAYADIDHTSSFKMDDNYLRYILHVEELIWIFLTTWFSHRKHPRPEQ